MQESEFQAGDRVQVLYDGEWCDCEVLEVHDGVMKARYDDGSDVEEDIDVSMRVRAVPEPLKVERGQRMQVLFEGVWSDCSILELSGDGETCTARYDDGAEEPDVDVQSRLRLPRIKLADLEVGQRFRGSVVSTPPFGVFVDIGAEKDGLVHISRMSEDRVENVEEYVMMGQEIDVWIASVEDGKFGLTMVEGLTDTGRQPQDLIPFADLPSDEWYDAVVIGTLSFGILARVTLSSGESAQGMVHISEIRDGFVEDVDLEVSEGQEIKVRVRAVDLDSHKMDLSMKDRVGSGGGEDGRRPDVDLTPFESVPGGEWLVGKVERIAPFGAFVAVTAPGTDVTAMGLVHFTCISDTYMDSAEAELEVGQSVRVRVDSVDVYNNKLDLSMIAGPP